MKLQPFYTLPELARAAGKSAHVVEAMLKDGHVLIETIPGKGGRVRVVYLAELRERMPSFFESLLIMGLTAREDP